MSDMIAKLLCKVMGHKRGKRVTLTSSQEPHSRYKVGIEIAGVIHNTYQCPRCHETWTRKARKATA